MAKSENRSTEIIEYNIIVFPPGRIFENIGVKSGLIGCVHSVKIGRYSVNLLGFEDGDLVTNSEGVTECQKSCSNGTCGCTGKNKSVSAQSVNGLKTLRGRTKSVAGTLYSV